MGEGTLAERPIGRITADDLEVAFRALEANGITGQTLNKYLQVCQHLQKWGVRRAICVRPWFDADNRPRQARETVQAASDGSSRTPSTRTASA